ncbi:MAG: preprotein translocase subunit YajC [Clostridia bacterium]|nr:preprotein translocase subunit YajC [Clostridia bacterium]
MLIVLIVAVIAMFVPPFIRQKKEMTARNELNESLKKGVKIITTAGVYGTIESIEDTTDGKVVTIVTGTSKNPTTMTIHINAIMGIDNKKPSNGKNDVEEKSTKKTEEVEEEVVSEEVQEEKKPTKKKTSK